MKTIHCFYHLAFQVECHVVTYQPNQQEITHHRNSHTFFFIILILSIQPIPKRQNT